MNEHTTNETNTERTIEPATENRYDSGQKLRSIQSAYEKELAKADRSAASEGEGGRRREARPGRTSARSILASFLVGALVVGGLSFLSDRLSLFTGDASGEAGMSASGGSAYSASSGITTASLNAEDDISSVFEQANPAVVEIENYGIPTDTYGAYLFGGRGGWMDGPQQQRQSAEPELMGTGTGFFFSEDGYILTNEHVIADASELKVTVPGYAEQLTAEVVSAYEELDIAVLKVESPDGQAFPTLAFGDSDQTKIGDWVIAIGNPYGLDHTMTVGVLSAKERPITIAEEDGTEHQYEHLLQTDASINPGNSGGPLLNERGEVIGMNTAVNAEAQGIGFAISFATIQSALSEMLAGASVSRIHSQHSPLIVHN
ncbi:S1C family serine protease [Cohnella massiliensis]|uniref:S1C family serine protease n=1 Tax=Cohnella massiliensis TaxID=1816691 RepID=UPI001FE99F27|nr:trypsin-like peptidase domain-containing protein [Cohnella massiliensis]